MQLTKANLNSHKLYVAFKPIWWFLTAMGQNPYPVIMKGVAHRPLYKIKFSNANINMLIHLITFAVFTTCYGIVSVAFVFFIVSNYADSDYDRYADPVSRMYVNVSYEKYLTRAELIPMVVFIGFMTITFVGFVTGIFKGRGYADYFNYWNHMVQVIDIEATMGVRRYFIGENIFCLFVVLVFTVLFIFGFYTYPEKAEEYKNGQGFLRVAIVANVVLKLFGEPFRNVNEVASSNEQGSQLYFFFAFLVVLYGIVASRCQTLPFLFYCRLLTNATLIWNERFRNLLRNIELEPAKQSNRRVHYGDLLRDHLVLVQLFKMTENVFSMSLITYYVFNLFCIVLELYYIFALLLDPLTSPTTIKVVKWNATSNGYEIDVTVTETVKTDTRTGYVLDEDVERAQQTYHNVFGFGIIFIIAVYQSFLIFKVTSSASQAYLHAMKGFDVLRRHNFLHCENKTERNFIHTLVFSFARNNPMVISGGGYFAVDKALIIAVIGNMVNFVVFVYQFKPDDWGDLEYNWGINKF